MNIFSIHDGRSTFWQWDLDRKLIVNDDVCKEVHFCNGTSDCSLVCEVYELQSQRVVDVPNILLQTARPIRVFAYVDDGEGAYTKRSALFQVMPRTKPEDYVYTETEVKNWDSLEKRIRTLEEGGGGAGVTSAEKSLILSLFKNTAYTADMSATISQLESLWSGSGDEPDAPDVPDVPDVPDEPDVPVIPVYTVTNNLTDVTNSNQQTEVTEGFYSATLSAEAGYTIETTIMMGGVDITASVYTAETGSILITQVTGNIVITATAKLASMPVLYRLSGTPKSVSGLSEDTGLAFGSDDASGVANAWSICFAYTDFGPSETLMKMSSANALGVATNGAGNNTKIRITCCSNVVEAYPSLSGNDDYRCIITREKSSLKMISAHFLENGAVKTVTCTGSYGQLNGHVGNLLVGTSDIMVNDLTIYKGVLSDAAIATYLNGGEI